MENSTQRHTKVNCLVKNVPQCVTFSEFYETFKISPFQEVMHSLLAWSNHLMVGAIRVQ